MEKMKKKLLKSLFFTISLIFGNIYTQNTEVINFLNINDLQNSITVIDKVASLSNDNKKDHAFLILFLNKINEILKNNVVIDSKIINESESLIKDPEEKEFLQETLNNLEQSINIFSTNLPKNSQLNKSIEFNQYINLCYRIAYIYEQLTFEGINQNLLDNLIQLTKDTVTYYKNLQSKSNELLKLKVNLMKPENSLIKKLQIFFYKYLNNQLIKFIKKNDISNSKQFIEYYNEFNKKLEFSPLEIDNILIPNNINIKENIKAIQENEAAENIKGKMKESINIIKSKPIQKGRRLPTKINLITRTQDLLNKLINYIDQALKNTKTEEEKNTLLKRKNTLIQRKEELEIELKKLKADLAEKKEEGLEKPQSEKEKFLKMSEEEQDKYIQGLEKQLQELEEPQLEAKEEKNEEQELSENVPNKKVDIEAEKASLLDLSNNLINLNLQNNNLTKK